MFASANCIGGWPGVDRDGIEKLIAEFGLEPVEVLYVVIVDDAIELDFIRHAPLVAANPDAIDLVRPTARAQVRMLHLKRLCTEGRITGENAPRCR